MTIRSKAIAAVLLLSLTPAMASAQSVPITNFGPGVGGAPAIGAPPVTILPAPTPVQGQDCGASQLQYFVNLPVQAFQATGIPARVLGPTDIVGLNFLPGRLNVAYDNSHLISSVYCG